MLATVRENLKGTLMIVVVVIFIVPMVISGVGTTFLGGGGGGADAAKVNGEAVTDMDLQRAISIRRNQIVAQQGTDVSADLLSDDALRTPVLDQLARRLALVSEGESEGMALSDKQFQQAVQEQEAFFTDGKFNPQKYNSVLAQNGLSSSGFRREVKNDLVLNQQALGIQLSSFVTPSQVEQLIKLTHQKRSFFSVQIPLAKAESEINISAEDIQSYYDQNTAAFEVPEKVKVDYIELSVSKLAESVEVSDAEVREVYDAEVANFSNDASYEVAHILLEGDNEMKADEVSEKILAGEDFAELAKLYSDDIASSESGGNLGILTQGMFPDSFEQAVYGLEESQVSEAVKTDFGTHFIKVIKKVETEIPSFDVRRDALKVEIAKARALDEFTATVDTLGELTYFSENLADASQQLGLPIQQSAYFDRSSGSGIAENASVRNAAFDEKVLTLGNNSNTIEVNSESVVVVRVADRKAAYIKSLDQVMPLVEANVKKDKINIALASLSDAFISAVNTGRDAQTLASDKGYTFETYELAKRSDFDVNPEALSLAFSADKPSASLSFNSRPARDGGFLLVGVSEMAEGRLSDLEQVELDGFEAQIIQELSTLYGSTYEASVFQSADVSIY